MKKLYRLWFALALLVCVTITAAAVIPNTLAYVQQQSNTVTNKFHVVYTPPEDISVPVHVYKTVRSLGEETISPADFAFSLYNITTGETITLITDEYGHADASLTFTAQDAGKTYLYELTEIAGANDCITYSDKVYSISIALTVGQRNTLQAAVTVNDVPVEHITAAFENLFDPITLPDTGDHSLPLLCVATLLISTAGLILLRRRRAL